MDAVTENKPPIRVRMKPRGKSSRRHMVTYDGDGTRACKTKYTGSDQHLARGAFQIGMTGLMIERAARSFPGGRLRR